MIWADFKSDFYKLINGDKRLSELRAIASKTGSLSDVKAASNRLGELLFGFITDNGIEAGAAQEVIEALGFPALTASYREVSDITAEAIGKQLKDLGFGFSAKTVNADYDRINGLLNKAEYFDAESGLVQPITADRVKNILEDAVIETAKENASFSDSAGVKTYVTRSSGSGCCDWCNSMTGRYVYGSEPSDFWRVHSGCTCTFKYEPSRRRATTITYNGRKKVTSY